MSRASKFLAQLREAGLQGNGGVKIGSRAKQKIKGGPRRRDVARKWKRETGRRQKANIECQYELPGIKLFHVLRFRIADHLFASPRSSSFVAPRRRRGGANTRNTRESRFDRANLIETYIFSLQFHLRCEVSAPRRSGATWIWLEEIKTTRFVFRFVYTN